MYNRTISVAMATYKGERYIRQQLESIINQNIDIDEIVICDDSPDTETKNIIDSLNFKNINLRYYKNSVQLGPVCNFQKAISLCNGEFIALADQDDIWREDKLSILVKELEQQNNQLPNLVFSNLNLIDNSGKIIKDRFFDDIYFSPAKYSFQHLLFEGFLMGCAMVINHKLAEEIKKMPSDVIMHDYWIHLVALSLGNVIYMDQCLMKYRSHEESVTTKESLSLLGKIAKEIKSSSSYLMDNIQQAKSFLGIYARILPMPIKREIDEFIQLENKSFLIKRLKAKLVKKKDNEKA